MEDGNSSDDGINGIEKQAKPIKGSTQSHFPKLFNGNYVEYSENTTIHGIKYLGEPRRPFAERMFWIIIFVFCFSLLGYFMRDVVIKWNRCPVILVEDDLPTPIYSIPFPAVTICPQIKAKYDKFSYETLMILQDNLGNTSDLDDETKKSLLDFLTKLEIAHQICHSFTTKRMGNMRAWPLRKTINESYIKLLYELSPNLDETIEEAMFKINFMNLLYNHEDGEEGGSGDLEKEEAEDQNAKHLFSSVLTNEGVCFTFNMPREILREDGIQKAYSYNNFNATSNNWDSENGYNLKGGIDVDFFPLFIFGAGKEFGLQIQLQSLVRDMYRLCQPTQVGFKIALHAPTIYPTTYEDYILVNYESITNIAVKPKIIKTSDSLRMYSPHRRQCYFANERRLKYFSYYNKVNCKLECLSNFTMKIYKCVHYSLPMDPGTNICGARAHADGAYSQMYNYAENMESVANLAEESDPTEKYDRVNDLECDCLPECNSIEYAYDVETELIDFHKINEKFQEDINVTEKLTEVYTEINIFIKDTGVFGKTRNQLYTFSDLVSNFGGLMGLFMGASMISLVELIYFCSIRHICKSRVNRRQEN